MHIKMRFFQRMTENIKGLCYWPLIQSDTFVHYKSKGKKMSKTPQNGCYPFILISNQHWPNIWKQEKNKTISQNLYLQLGLVNTCKTIM